MFVVYNLVADDHSLSPSGPSSGTLQGRVASTSTSRVVPEMAGRVASTRNAWTASPSYGHEPSAVVRARCVELALHDGDADTLAAWNEARRRYRRSGAMARIGAEKRAWAAGSTGRCLTLVLAGSFPR